jgi:hypothetical protein
VRIFAVDWSGARDEAEQRKKIWIAEARDGRVIRLEAGRTRNEVAAWFIREAAATPAMRIGFDFAFGFPAWFPREHGCTTAYDVWRLAESDGHTWLAESPVPFWGRNTTRPDLGDPARHWRAADHDVAPVAGIRPKSTFQIGGAGAVGTATVRGMRTLQQLHDAGIAIWPFDTPRADGPAALEIWPRLLTGPVVKSSTRERIGLLARYATAIPSGPRELAASSEDAFDAAIAALAMDANRDVLVTLPAARSADEQLEGRIWMPARPYAPAGNG